MILTVYQADPQFRIAQAAGELLGAMGLEDRGLGAAEGLVIEGHPLFEYATRSEGDDSYFPKIGIEWQSDEQERQDVNWNNIQYVRLDGRLRQKLEHYLSRDSLRMMSPAGNSDFLYEQVSAKKIPDFLDCAEECQFARRHVSSLVLATGWATGNAAKKAAQFLYMAFDGILPFLSGELRRNFRVTAEVVGNPSLNLVNDQFGPAHGFEMMLKLTQIKQTFRLIPKSEYDRPESPFIFAELGGTNLDNFFNHGAAA